MDGPNSIHWFAHRVVNSNLNPEIQLDAVHTRGVGGSTPLAATIQRWLYAINGGTFPSADINCTLP
jgi:hypothetical protein